MDSDHGSGRPRGNTGSFDIAQRGDPALDEPAEAFALPREAGEARWVVARLQAAADRVSEVCVFRKGLGLAAPQIGISGAAAIVRPQGGSEVVLLNPRIVEASVEEMCLYEGCLSFFDVRGLVPRPKVIDVEHQDLDGNRAVTRCRNGLARLVAHEVDHLAGVLYTARMLPGSDLIPLSEVPDLGHPWPEGRGRAGQRDG